MKDSRSMLDGVRSQLHGDEKMLNVYIDRNGTLRCAQSNLTQADFSSIVASLQNITLSPNLGKVSKHSSIPFSLRG
jgi:hypothetical protein